MPSWSPDSVRDLAGLTVVLCCFTSLTLLPSGFRNVQFGLGRLVVHCGDSGRLCSGDKTSAWERLPRSEVVNSDAECPVES